MYYLRHIEETIKKLKKQFACITLYGARQVGKSTTVAHVLSDKFKYVTLDDSEQRNLALSNPKLFLETNTWPLVIDEIQRVPSLLSYIKIEIDNQKYKWLTAGKQTQLMYVLTGSNQFELQKVTVESLAGRTAVLNMASLSLAEKDGKNGDVFNPEIDKLREKESKLKSIYRNRRQMFEEIFEGGMPEYVTAKPDRDMFFKSYVDTYIEKDVKLLISSASEFSFRSFLALVALRTAQEVNWDDLSRSVGIDVKTCKRWMSILETSGIVVLMQPYMKNASTSIIKSPKVYFMDTGLCAYLCKWPNAEMLENCAMSGAFFETFVVSEIIKSYINYGLDWKNELYYFRTMGQKEVDLIIVKNDEIYPIEIKKGIAPSNPTKNFSALDIYKKIIKTGIVIDSCERIFPINTNAYYCPVSLI